nr:magnesium/cobalt transporter CorA [uncultured Arsenicibacter sp.]
MTKRRHRYSDKNLGTSPGTVTYVGQEIEHATHIRRVEYNAETYRIDESGRLSACRLPAEDAPFVTWVDVDGIHQSQVIEAIGDQYKLHPLLLEDVVNTHQKPKLEPYDDTTIFVTLKMLHYDDSLAEIDSEHVSLVLGRNFVVSFQEERTNDIFDPVLNRIKASAGKTRRNGADYLFYALLDVIVDHYFSVLERVGERLDILEDHIVQQQAGQPTLTMLYALKRELNFMRRVVWPVREMIGMVMREESVLIQSNLQPYLRDLYDHVSQVIETLDSYRELIPGLMDLHLSTVSNRMNSVMKTLTIFSAIFMPLTFIVGVYGMNFEHMPELSWHYGYYTVWAIMGVVTVALVIYFKKRGWM